MLVSIVHSLGGQSDLDIDLELDNIRNYQLLPDEIRLKSAKTKYIIKTFLPLLLIRSSVVMDKVD